ncbi:hypothetical protein MTR67_030649, partial [Solanum verrucosum]
MTTRARGHAHGVAPIAHEVIWTTTDQQCYERFQKIKPPQFQDRYIPWNVREESFLIFESLVLGGLPVTEYEAHFCEISRHAMTIIQNEAERIFRFVRGLNFSIRSYVFKAAKEGTSFLSIVSTAKEAELMVLEEFGEPKRARYSAENGSHPDGLMVLAKDLNVLFISSSKGFNASGQRLSVDPPPMDSVPVVREFIDVFPTNLSGVPPDRDIDFSIDLELRTKPIFIPPYRMALAELKELKDKLQELLRHVVSKEGIRVHPAKIEATRGWTRPTSSVSFQWSDECEVSFQKLKTLLNSAVVLTLPEESVDFTVYCDASRVGLGGVLMQTFKRDLNLRQRRWLELLKDYDITILYHLDKANALSKKYSSMGNLSAFSIEERPLARDVPRQCIFPIERFDSIEMDSLDTKLLRDIMEQGVMCFGKKGKLSPRFIGPFEILSHVGEVAYKLALPPSLSYVHPVFHVSILWQYVLDESYVLSLGSVELGLATLRVRGACASFPEERGREPHVLGVSIIFAGGQCVDLRVRRRPDAFAELNTVMRYVMIVMPRSLLKNVIMPRSLPVSVISPRSLLISTIRPSSFPVSVMLLRSLLASAIMP